MNRNNNKLFKLPFFDSLCIFFIMWSSGTQFNQDYPYAMYGLVISFAGMIMTGDFSTGRRMGGAILMVALLDILSVLHNFLFYNGQDIFLIQKVFVLLLTVLLYMLNKPYRNLERIKLFVALILLFSIISNVLFILHATSGLPMKPTLNENGEHFYYLQKNIINTIAIGLRVRNSGIYWEPGMYQVYLTFALQFCLYLVHNRFRFFLAAYLIISIISTFSVSGYVVCALLMGIFALKNQSGTLMRIIYFAVIILALFYVMPYMQESLTLKQNTGSYEARSNDLFFGLDVFARSPVFGFGVGNHEYANAYMDTFGEAREDSNGMLNIMISMGIFGILLVVLFFIKILEWLKNNVSSLIIVGFSIWFWISINTEPIVFHPFFFFLIGIGVSSIKIPIDHTNKSVFR